MKRMIKYIIIAFSVWVLQIWGEHSEVAENIFEGFIEPFFDNISLPVVYTVILLLAIWEYYRGRIRELESENKNEMELQIKAHKQLSAYRRRDLFNSFVSSFVEREDAVQAVQLYKYTLKRKSGLIEVKVEYVDGNVHEGIGLNALLQNYFYLDKGMYKDFCAAKSYWDRYHKVGALLTFIKKYRTNFVSLSPEDVNEDYATQFAMLQLAVDIVEDWLHEEYDQVLELELLGLPDETLIRLNEVKRTGILRSILLLNSYYRFFHTGLGEKHGRLYLSRYVYLWDVHHVFMITLDPDILEEQTAQEELDQIQKRFLTGLQNSFDLVYTRDNSSNGGDRLEEAE